jgi:nitroreductase
VFELATQVNAYYLSFETLLRRWYLWPLLWFTAARPYLKSPRKIAAIRTRAQRFDREHDWLFFRAPAVVVLSAPRKNRAFGRTNSVIAAERMMQYAFALGLGSCWIGYAEVALQRRSAIAEWIGIGPDRCPQAVFTLGRPAVEYHRLPVRRPLSVRWV